jgi:hypothetical protein
MRWSRAANGGVVLAVTIRSIVGCARLRISLVVDPG